MSHRSLRLVGGENEEEAVVMVERKDELCHLVLHYRGRRLEASAFDSFEAFSRVRVRLEEGGLIPFCYGASLDVFPSGMCRDMGAGLVAYRLTKGKPTEEDDFVHIFDAGPDVLPASVAEQRAYHEEWLRSLRAKTKG